MDPRKLLIARRIAQVSVGVIGYNCYLKVISTKIIYDGPLKAGCVPGLNCHACPMAISSCPIGALQFYSAQHQFPLYLMGFLAVLGVIGGRFICGWLCPFGFLQDMMYKIRSIKISVPRLLGYFRWFSLIVLAILLPFLTGKHWFSALCPNGALIAAIPWAVWNPIDPLTGESTIPPEAIDFDFWLKMVILAGFLIWFVFTKRPFCRTSCPLGLIYGWFNRSSIVMPSVKEVCADCGQCTTRCPVDLVVRTEVNTAHCIKCLDCTACKFVEYRWNWKLKYYKIPKFLSSRQERLAAKAAKKLNNPGAQDTDCSGSCCG
ncbi:MAG: 4Fe-4S binding protein [bacterium]|nr:4Fe-4S binding protein [bacterium]